ncbi:hypothetical protein MCA1934 [Methylococcus capsulatus str. Bath]|jgi:hypothetical protein|uniref:Uncharacterized protein n=1 Tax=Methylococcus capsulatus (strain ATCC 33009 / NCIMB 11132 / Bath) TaxID=243233 RepID=Q606T1_METCA|nr:hypothetical protein MCA1934 [Methylococcus capsulatus str. Bath]
MSLNGWPYVPPHSPVVELRIAGRSVFFLWTIT